MKSSRPLLDLQCVQDGEFLTKMEIHRNVIIFNLPGQICNASVVNVGYICKRHSMLSIVEENRVETGHSKHHPIRKAVHWVQVVRMKTVDDGGANLVSGTEPLA